MGTRLQFDKLIKVTPYFSGPGGLGLSTAGSLTPPPPASALAGLYGGNGAANNRGSADPLRAAQQQQQQQAVMAAVAAATGMRTALFAQAAAAQAAQSVVGPHSAVNGLFGGKTRHNSIDKPAPNRSRLLEDFRCLFNLLHKFVTFSCKNRYTF